MFNRGFPAKSGLTKRKWTRAGRPRQPMFLARTWG